MDRVNRLILPRSLAPGRPTGGSKWMVTVAFCSGHCAWAKKNPAVEGPPDRGRERPTASCISKCADGATGPFDPDFLFFVVPIARVVEGEHFFRFALQQIGALRLLVEELAEPEHVCDPRLRSVKPYRDSHLVPVEEHAEEPARHVFHARHIDAQVLAAVAAALAGECISEQCEVGTVPNFDLSKVENGDTVFLTDFHPIFA